MKSLHNWLEKVLFDSGVSEVMVPYLRLLIMLTILVLVAIIAFFITKKLVVQSLYRFFKRTSVKWDDALAEHQVFNKLAHIVPAIIIRIFAEIIFRDFDHILPLVVRLTDAYLIIVCVMIVVSLLRVAEFSLAGSKAFADKPISSYFQLVRIILYITTGILVLSVLISRSPLYFLSAFGGNDRYHPADF